MKYNDIIRLSNDELDKLRHKWFDDDEETAAIREVEEECGIVGPVVDRFLTTTLHVFSTRERRR